MKKRILVLSCLLVFMMSISTISLAAQSKGYNQGGISHLIDCGPIDKTWGQWSTVYDQNSSVSFANTALEAYHNSKPFVYVSGAKKAAGGIMKVSSGFPATTQISSYGGTTNMYLEIKNPYYGTSNASPMTTVGTFFGIIS